MKTRRRTCIWRVWPQEQYEILKEGVMHTYVSVIYVLWTVRKKGGKFELKKMHKTLF